MKVLFRFWLRRLAFTICAAAAMLLAINSYRYGYSQSVLMDTWFWAVVTGLCAATLSTYWAYSRHCKQLKKRESEQ